MDSGTVMRLAGELLLTSIILIFLIYPLVLSAANRLINGFWSPYWRTLGTLVITGIVAGIISFIVRKAAGVDHLWLIRIVSIIVTAVVGGGIMKGFVHRKDGEPLPYGRTSLACLVLGIVVVLLGLGFGPWQKSMSAQLKAAMPAAASASKAPATAQTADAAMAATTAMAASAPAAASSASVSAATSQTMTAVPAGTASTPAASASTH